MVSLKKWSVPLTAGLFLIAMCQACLAADKVLPESTFADLIAGREVAFLAQMPEGSCVLGGSDLEARHAPWSTFKIPNLIIALETGVASDLGALRQWDPARHPSSGFGPKVWFQDHTLKSAFQASVVWYFRDVARDVGMTKYRQFLRGWDYGNAQVQGQSDGFWLNQGLAISVAEQVAFISRVLDGSAAMSVDTRDALGEAAFVGRSDDTSLFAKTGAGPVDRGAFEGWYVGWVARSDGDIPFTLYTKAKSYAALRDFRKAFALRLLETCGALPAGF